jgi:hypothetical protein
MTATIATDGPMFIRLISETDTGATCIHDIGGRDRAVVAKRFKHERTLALRRGETVIEADGSRVWRAREIVYNRSNGTMREVWNEAGDRIKCHLYEVTQDADGHESRSRLRVVWVGWDAAYK